MITLRIDLSRSCLGRRGVLSNIKCVKSVELELKSSMSLITPVQASSVVARHTKLTYNGGTASRVYNEQRVMDYW